MVVDLRRPEMNHVTQFRWAFGEPRHHPLIHIQSQYPAPPTPCWCAYPPFTPNKCLEQRVEVNNMQQRLKKNLRQKYEEYAAISLEINDKKI